MKIVEILRQTKEAVIDGYEVSQSIMGTANDTNNFTISTIPNWDDTKTDYAIGDVVKVDGWFFEYTCLVEGTRNNPLLSSDWKKSGTISEYRFRDESPTRYSYTDVDVPIVATMYISRDTNYFFGQNFKNISHILIEALDDGDNVVEVLYDKTLSELLQFQKYNCCSIQYTTRTTGALEIGGCGIYSKIRVTLTPNVGKIPKVGSMGVGTQWDIGCMNEYPSLRGVTLAKFEVQDVDLSLHAGATYVEADVSTYFDGLENSIDAILLKNIGKLVFFDMNEFPEKNITKFLGYYKESQFNPKNSYQNIKLKIYGVVSVSE